MNTLLTIAAVSFGLMSVLWSFVALRHQKAEIHYLQRYREAVQSWGECLELLKGCWRDLEISRRLHQQAERHLRIAENALAWHEKQEVTLRRKLETLRARKRAFCAFDEFEINLFTSPPPYGFTGRNSKECVRKWVDGNIRRWRKDRTEGNWGKYLKKERQVKANANS